MMKGILVGAGSMAVEYAKVLKALEIEFDVIGRSEKSSSTFESKTGKSVITGGLENSFFELDYFPDFAIVVTTLETLEQNTLYLLNNGVKKILLEKPGALTLKGIEKIKQYSHANNAEVYIGYNRRFYNSVIEAKRRIEKDGGVTSFLFEFTEWAHIVTAAGKNKEQLANWFIGNSSHVLDTAFYLCGKPKQWSGFKQSHIDWHPKGSIFVGAGITENEIPFSYHANWNAPGSWKLEILTDFNRYIFRPFEKLKVQEKGSIEIKEIELTDSDDIEFKPGLLKQINTFFYVENKDMMLSINESTELMKFYEKLLD